MPATVTLSTRPGSIERHDAYSTLSVEVSGPLLGREDVAVATVQDVRAAVKRIGECVRAAHPHASFLIRGSPEAAAVRVSTRATRPTAHAARPAVTGGETRRR